MSYTHSRISYDNKFDVLYLSLVESDNSYGDELNDNIIMMKDIDTNDITGITVIGFVKLYNNDDETIKILQQFFDVEQVASKCLEVN